MRPILALALLLLAETPAAKPPDLPRAEVDPDNPVIWYNRAADYARKGDRKRALADLRQAAGKGWKDVVPLQGDGAFAPLRQDPEFQQIVSKIH